MITNDEVARIRDEIGRLALQAARIDLDGFLEAAEVIGSPQALASGIEPRAVTSAAEWTSIARLLKPFRDDAVTRLDRIREVVSEDEGDLVDRTQACPRCGERRVDELGLNEDGSVVCAICGRLYSLESGGGE